MRRYLSLLSIVIFLDVLAQAKVQTPSDPFNSYRWNRSNVLARNGEIDRRPWFEWWYYKVVEPKTNRAFFMVYGVTDPWDSNRTQPGTRAFVSVGSYQPNLLIESIYNLGEFEASYDRTAVSIGAVNQATDLGIKGKIDQNGNRAEWDIEIRNEWTFNAMGWAMGVEDISNIFWYPAQASAKAFGTIVLNGVETRFEGAPAYQDRNWGTTFPDWWAWIVANDFREMADSYLAVGGGKPHVFNGQSPFSGLCIGFHHKGKDYEFRFMDADFFKFDIQWGRWEISAINKKGYKIEISAYAPLEKFLTLPFLTPSGKTFYDYEALQGFLRVKLYKQNLVKWQLIADLTSERAGIEWGTPDPLSFQSLFLGNSEMLTSKGF